MPREAFDVLGREGERSQLAPLADLDVLVKAHQPSVRALAPADDDRRDHFAQRLAGGVAGHALEGHDARFGAAVRHPRFRHIDIERQVVAGTQRRHPFQFVDAGRAERGGVADERIEHHPHHQRAEMPARAGKSLQHGLAGGLLVEMHRLRIEFGGKRQNLLARDMARSVSAKPADAENLRR